MSGGLRRHLRHFDTLPGKRQGTVGIPTPFLLYDPNVAYTGGSGNDIIVIPNLGSGGSDWDLDTQPPGVSDWPAAVTTNGIDVASFIATFSTGAGIRMSATRAYPTPTYHFFAVVRIDAMLINSIIWALSNIAGPGQSPSIDNGIGWAFTSSEQRYTLWEDNDQHSSSSDTVDFGDYLVIESQTRQAAAGSRNRLLVDNTQVIATTAGNWFNTAAMFLGCIQDDGAADRFGDFRLSYLSGYTSFLTGSQLTAVRNLVTARAAELNA